MSTQAKALQRTYNMLPVNTDSLQSYLQQIKAIPLLSQEEEFTLAKRYREQGDLGAAQQLVLSHLRYVAKIAKSYNGYGLALNDLIQEGTIGLMKAVKRFDPAKGVRLVSFAVHWIKSEIHEFVIRNWRIVKIATTKAQRKLFFNLRQSKKRLGWFSQEEVQSVANDLGVSPKDVMEMETRLNAHDHTFDMTQEEGEIGYSPVQYLPAAIENEPDFDDGQEQPQGELQAVFETLDPRSQDIVAKRWLSDEKMSLKELAEHHGISIERVRQLEKTALQKMRQVLAHSENL